MIKNLYENSEIWFVLKYPLQAVEILHNALMLYKKVGFEIANVEKVKC